ncbi:MAG: hemolysin III family protein [Propionibacteriaceae bacterium]|jgi:hemolysin III|nr:hemolysin III family protein [Propionibacteriaceae bacterium]
MRGWLHAMTVPLILAASIVFLVLANGWEAKLAMAVYLATSLFLFANSATYHLFNWRPKIKEIFRKIDHSNIFLFIAGTYTPLSTILLRGTDRIVILTLVWVIAAAGVIFQVAWVTAPRWLIAIVYVAMGWVAIWWLPEFWASGGPAIVWLVLGGGIVYSIGAFVYAKKWPNPSPEWFGYHEVFHLCTVLAAAAHFVAIALAVSLTWV